MRRYLELRVFACEGLVCIIDERPGKEASQYTVVTPKDLEHRLRVLNKKYRNQTPAEMTTVQRERHRKRVHGSDELMECVKEARDMGDPSDPAVQAFWAKHRRNSTISMSARLGQTDREGYPVLPQLPVGPKTGRTAAADGVLAQAGSSAVPKIHRPPRRKNRKGLVLLDD